MTKKNSLVIVSVTLLILLLSGCKLPASEAPTEEVMTTPIVIQTEEPEAEVPEEDTPTEEVKSPATPTLEIVFTPTPTIEPTPTVMIPTLTKPVEYTVQSGEYPYCLARRFNVNPEDLLELNGIGDAVSPGTVLQIPQTGTWPLEDRSTKDHPASHTVEAGDTVYSIACEYGDVTPEAIIAVNRLEEPYALTAGQVLQIP